MRTSVSTFADCIIRVKWNMHTRTARALRVTIMMGQTGLYFATKRAVLPL